MKDTEFRLTETLGKLITYTFSAVRSCLHLFVVHLANSTLELLRSPRYACAAELGSSLPRGDARRYSTYHLQKCIYILNYIFIKFLLTTKLRQQLMYFVHFNTYSLIRGWNSLTDEMRTAATVNSFSRLVRKCNCL